MALIKHCTICNKEFLIRKFRIKTAKFCSYKCYGIFQRGKTKISSVGKNNTQWKGGLPKCLSCNKQIGYRNKRCMECYIRSDATTQNGLKGLIKQQNMKEPTGIERKVYDYLILKGILFEKQRLINGKFLVDAYIPSLNLVIEADGKYWHDMDRVMKKDKAENAYLNKCGFNLIRLTEEEINSGEFKERLVI